MTATFGQHLRDWRTKRRYSQLSFSLHADVSARHVSFLESGRARPSRDMVLRLAQSLEMPRAEVNRALQFAGFTPAYSQRAPDHADLAPIRAAIEALLQNHMPYPALAMDGFWNVTALNPAAMRLMSEVGFAGHSNLLAALASQTPEQSAIINWSESIGLLLTRLQSEMPLAGLDAGFDQHVKNLQDLFDAHGKSHRTDSASAVIPTRFAIGEQEISLFSTIAQFGTVQDISLAELKVELMFPMDDGSADYFRTLAETADHDPS